MNKVKILRRLRDLRQEIEEGQGALSEEQACLLTDVCQRLDLVEAEVHYVVGEAFATFIVAPVPYRLVYPGAFVVAFARQLGAVDIETLSTAKSKNSARARNPGAG